MSRPDSGSRGSVLRPVALLVASLALAACSTSSHFVHSQYDFSTIKKVAVLPLENLSADQMAGEKVRKAVVSELLAAGVVDVVETGQVNRTLAQANIQNISTVSADELKKVGAALGTQALIVGSVDTYERLNVGGANFPEIAITLRAIDATTGSIIWSATKTGGGVGIAGRLFGVGGQTLSEATQKTVRAALTTLFQ
jgi:hypothetical protein